MLLQFNFKNFKSFRDDTTLDFTATKIKEFSDRVVKIANEKILPVAAIFGANAHGKSNVLEAFEYMHIYVLDSAMFGGESNSKKTEIRVIKPTPFLFDKNSKDKESSFEVYFIDSDEKGSKTYNYGFSINNNGVVEEWLNSKAKTSNKFRRIFYRNTIENVLDMPGIKKNMQENVKISLQKETLVVSLGAMLKCHELEKIRNWFRDNESMNFDEPMENLIFSRLLPEGFLDNETVRKNVVNYLSSFDSSIIDFDVKKVKDDDDDGREIIIIDSIHRMIDSDQTAKIPFRRESAGTLKMFSLYSFLQDVMEKGSVLFVDELNSRLHPLLVRLILITFLDNNINKNHAQLIFTTHDAWQLNGCGLRRDEIWFVEKDNDGVSTLYSLSDYVDDEGAKIRNDENFQRNYLLGKYGAIPELKALDIWGENCDGK